ncbi:MAG: hypothetical protein IJO69_02880 [Ruminiclostridium sp.]|nr:hypothetical protein [Ruminiclostridium sp.]
MRVEFLINEEINDGRQIFIVESEFKKAKTSDEEFNSFAFATNCLYAYYGHPDLYITQDEYDVILASLEKGGAVIISIVEERYPRRAYPEVYVSNNNRLKRVQL